MTREQARLILGVEISASSDDIRSAHRRVMRSVHPDTNRTEEAERFARMANEAREILDPPALADDPAPPAHEPTEGEFEAARHHLATAADVIRTYLNTDPEERRLNTDLEEPGLEPHVCELVWKELIRRGVAEGVGVAVCTMVCRTDFLQNGNNNGYWTYNGVSLRSVLDAPHPTEEEKFQNTKLSTMCIRFASVGLCVSVAQVLFGSSDETQDVLAGLLALQIILGAGAYRSRKLRSLRLAPNTSGQRRSEHGRLVASVLCGVVAATGEIADLAIITIPWILGAYAVASAFAVARYRRAFTQARRWFEEDNHPD